MTKQEEERRAFDMAKLDVPFLRNLELVKHDDRPDFVLKDKDGRKIGLEHFRADVYQVQDTNSSHISGGHSILNYSKDKMFEKYHDFAINGLWSKEINECAFKDVLTYVRDAFNMQSHYTYNKFLDNLRVGIHGRSSKVKGHIYKSKNYPERDSYDLMGFLIEIPVPSFQYCFETISSQKISRFLSSLYGCPLNIKNFEQLRKRFNDVYSSQKINGIPITNEIWGILNVFDDIDFIIIETYDSVSLKEHYGQYFDKNTSISKIYPAFSFGLTDLSSIECKDNNIIFNSRLFEFDIIMTNSMLKAARQRQNRKTRKCFDKATRRFRQR